MTCNHEWKTKNHLTYCDICGDLHKDTFKTDDFEGSEWACDYCDLHDEAMKRGYCERGRRMNMEKCGVSE